MAAAIEAEERPLAELPPTLLYHVCPADVFDSGIDYRLSTRPDWRESEQQRAMYPQGNYVTDRVGMAYMYQAWAGGEIYEINGEDLVLHPDPDEEWDGRSAYTTTPIEPWRILGIVVGF